MTNINDMKSLVHSDSKFFDSFFVPQENVIKQEEGVLHDMEIVQDESKKEVEEIKVAEVVKNEDNEEELYSPDDTKSVLQTPNKDLKFIRTRDPEDEPIESNFTIKRYRLML